MPLDMKMTILIVDDSGTMRMMFQQMLKKAGFENFVLAVDGQDAMEKLQENNNIDLIVSDWNMPRKDGMDLLKWVRKNETFKDIPFMMATAQGDKTQQEYVKQEGGNGHIAKPFDADEIKLKINQIFEPKVEETPSLRKAEFRDGKVVMKIAHIQITDHLALGVLKHQIESGQVTPKHFVLETERIAGWNPIQELLERGDVDGAFVLAPIAMDLFAFDVPIKLVLLAHKNGSSFVRNRNFETQHYDSLKSFYKYKVVNIPHKMSVHHMLSYKFLTELGLKPGVPGKKAIDVRFEVVPPIKMPEIMADNEDVAGFMVAEPIATKAIVKDIANLQFLSASMWQDHPCCVATMREEFIQGHPDAVEEFTDLLVKAGQFVENNKLEAAEIAVNFLDPDKKLGLTVPVLQKVLSEPQGIRMNDLYPLVDDLDKIQRYMHDVMEIGRLIDVDKFVEISFANKACNRG